MWKKKSKKAKEMAHGPKKNFERNKKGKQFKRKGQIQDEVFQLWQDGPFCS